MKTYQEAKIANPDSDIYENDDGEFGTREQLSKRVGQYVYCHPADYCMTVEKFLADGHKFVDGDLYINLDGNVIEFKRKSIPNVIADDPRNSNRLILRAAALEQTETPEEKEAFDVMAQDKEASEAKAIAEYNKPVNEWNNGDECVIRGEKLIYIGESIEADIHCVQELGSCIYRNAHISVIDKPKAEREAFIEAYNSLGREYDNSPTGTKGWVYYLFDSGKFKLVEGE